MDTAHVERRTRKGNEEGLNAGNEHRSRERGYKANYFPNFSTAVSFVDVCIVE